MVKITLISTIHEESGHVNAHNLCDILTPIRPDVVFVEALKTTYFSYQKEVITRYGVFHKKLEIEAIQLLNHFVKFEYVPVLTNESPSSFKKKYEIANQSKEFQLKFNSYQIRAERGGFEFINTEQSIELQEEMRILSDYLVEDQSILDQFYSDQHQYEDEMIECIFQHCSIHQFSDGVFLCGGHRESMIQKLNTSPAFEKLDVNWCFWSQ